MALRSGLLRQVVSFERLADTQELDDDGNVLQTWEAVPYARRVPAAISDVSGSELERGQSIESVSRTRILIRFIDGLSTSMRIRRHTDDKVFNIDRIGDPDGMRRELVVIAKDLDAA